MLFSQLLEVSEPTSTSTMPTPVTEIAFLPLAANAQIENASSQAGRKWKAIVDTVADQAGFVGGFLGRQIEDDTIVMHLVGTKPRPKERAYQL